MVEFIGRRTLDELINLITNTGPDWPWLLSNLFFDNLIWNHRIIIINCQIIQIRRLFAIPYPTPYSAESNILISQFFSNRIWILTNGFGTGFNTTIILSVYTLTGLVTIRMKWVNDAIGSLARPKRPRPMGLLGRYDVGNRGKELVTTNRTGSRQSPRKFLAPTTEVSS